MKHLFRGSVAVASALLLSAGLTGMAGAAPGDCTITINDPANAAEGNEDESGFGVESERPFTVSATSVVENGCSGVEVTYAYSGSATLADEDATNDFDYYGDNEPLEFNFNAEGEVETLEVPVTIVGDLDNEDDETIVVTLTLTGGEATLSDASGTTTITDDDPGIAAGGKVTASPTSGPSGTVITVSGTGCEVDTVDLVIGASSGQSGGIVAETEDVPVKDDGTFKGTITVPANSDPSFNYQVGATCGSGSYPGVPFDVTGTTGADGYRMVAADGGIFTFGDRTFHGSTGNLVLNKPIVGGATDISDFDGYWIVASDGGVFTFNAEFYGSLAGQTLPAPAVEIEPTPTGKGYWIVLANGKVYTFGDANFFGDISGSRLNKPVIGMSVTPSGKGYWLVAEDGGIFNYGDARFFGSMGDQRLNAPVIDLAPAVDNNGYYLLGRDGGVFTFGSAEFKGSTGSTVAERPRRRHARDAHRRRVLAGCVRRRALRLRRRCGVLRFDGRHQAQQPGARPHQLAAGARAAAHETDEAPAPLGAGASSRQAGAGSGGGVDDVSTAAWPVEAAAASTTGAAAFFFGGGTPSFGSCTGDQSGHRRRETVDNRRSRSMAPGSSSPGRP